MAFRNLRLALATEAVLAGGLLLASNASATVMNTLLTGTTGTVTLSLNGLVFNNDPAAIGGGNSDVANGTNLTFLGCASGVLGSFGCLSAQEGVTVNNADLTLAAPAAANADTFLTFAAHPSLVYSISWPPGPGAANTNCAAANSNGLSCSVFAGSPIILTYASGDTFLDLVVRGRASDTGFAGLAAGSLYTGGFSDLFSSPLPNGMPPTPLDIQQYFCPSVPCTPADFSAGRFITTSQSGTFSATTPEPGTLALFGSGLVGLAGLVRRKLAQT
jgi:PEP-CTERM motif-containing protein